jgi:preprotein translocase subunit SecG
MGLIGILILVLFVIVSILLILLVLVQNEEGNSLGGIFAGGSGSAFGSRSGNILTKTTYVLGALFLLSSFTLALINRTPGDSGVEAAAKTIENQAAGDWWKTEPAPAAPAPAADAAVPAAPSN